MSTSIPSDQLPNQIDSTQKREAVSEQKKEALKSSDYTKLMMNDFLKNGVSEADAKKFVNHPIVKKTVETYAASQPSAAMADAGSLGLYAEIMLVFATTQTRLNDQVAFWNEKQEEINKLLPEISDVINRLRALLDGSDKSGKPIVIPADLMQYIKAHDPGYYYDSSGNKVQGSLYQFLEEHSNNQNQGSLLPTYGPATLKGYLEIFSGYQTNLTTSNTTKVELQQATQKNLNFTKEMGQMLTVLFAMLKQNVQRL